MAARAIASGTISFGLVSIPVKLYTATSSEGIHFNMLHKKCGGRLKQQMYCPVDDEVVERSDIVKGYEYAKNQYVQMTDEEIKALAAERTDTLEILEFVPQKTVDLLYIEKSYYLGPDKGGAKPYHLLSAAMERQKTIAVGRFELRGREQLVLVRPYKKGLLLHYVYYENEVRSFDDVDTGGEQAFKPAEADLADKLIEQLTSDEFRPELYKDEYVERLKNAVEQKIAGEEVTTAPAQPTAQIIDMFEALKRSLDESPAVIAMRERKAKPPRKVEPKHGADEKSQRSAREKAPAKRRKAG